MEQTQYDELAKKPDRELYDFVTEQDSSQRKWVALHMLEERRNAVLTAAAKSSARAAWLAAAIAGASAIIAVLAYFNGGAA
jgi:hypothetical protein